MKSKYEVSSSTNTCNELFSHTIWISSIQNCKPLLSSVCALYRKEEAFWSYHLLPFVNAFTNCSSGRLYSVYPMNVYNNWIINKCSILCRYFLFIPWYKLTWKNYRINVISFFELQIQEAIRIFTHVKCIFTYQL